MKNTCTPPNAQPTWLYALAAISAKETILSLHSIKADSIEEAELSAQEEQKGVYSLEFRLLFNFAEKSLEQLATIPIPSTPKGEKRHQPRNEHENQSSGSVPRDQSFKGTVEG